MSNKRKASELPPDIEAYIAEAVRRGIEAGVSKVKKEAERNAFQMTEDRLTALPDIKAKVIRDTAHVEYLKQYNEPQRRSKDICLATGVRVTEDDAVEAMVQDLTARIGRNTREIAEVEWALEPIVEDPYYRTLDKYFKRGVPDKLMATELNCEETSVWRNRNRLVRRVRDRLYGVDALTH